MSFISPAKKETLKELNGLSPEQFIVSGVETAILLNWKISQVDNTGFVAFTPFSLSSWSEEVKVTIRNDTAIITSTCIERQLLDFGKNKKNINLLISNLESADKNRPLNEVADKLEEMIQLYHYIPETEESKEPLRRLTAKERLAEMFFIFIPSEGYFITPLLININLLVFLAMTVSGVHIIEPDNQSLINWGANFRPATLDGEWWRLFTSFFVHIGLFHLFLNMYALIYIGIYLEGYLGKFRFLSAYLLSGVASSAASLYWYELTISAGASGAIFGMYGVFLALLLVNYIERSLKNAYWLSMVIFVIYNLIFGLKADSGIDNAAHVGGLVTGFVIGFSFIPGLIKPDRKIITYSTITFWTVLLFISTTILYKQLPNDVVIYDREMEKFAELEGKAMLFYRLPDDAPNEVVLVALRDSGIYYWNETLKLIENLEILDLPEVLQVQNSLLKDYCKLRIENFHLLHKAYEKNTDVYNKEIKEYNLKINSIINELK